MICGQMGDTWMHVAMLSLFTGALHHIRQIWIWFEEFNWYLRKIRNVLNRESKNEVQVLPPQPLTGLTGLGEIIPANNCTMQGQNNWGNWGSPDVMKLCVVWEVLRWLMKFRDLCSGGFHPKLVTPPYHGFLNVNTPPNSQNSKRH